MKNIAKILSLLLALTMLFSMTSCFGKKLSGKYEAEHENIANPTLSGTFAAIQDGIRISYTFKDDAIIIEALGTKMEGTYKIEAQGSTYLLNATMELLGQKQTITTDISAKNDNTIIIDGQEYKAVEDSVKLDLQPTQFEFSGKNVEMTVEGYFLGKCVYDETFEGAYSIKKDEITFEFDDRDAKEWSDTFDFEEKNNAVVIDGRKYRS